jgi:hypothetical protein
VQHDALHLQRVLGPQRLIEVVLGPDVLLDLFGQLLFAIEGPAGAARMMKNEAVMTTKSTSTAETIRRMM